MNVEHYSIQSDSSFLIYKFQSVGPKGTIRKIVQFQKIENIAENIYNLLFGDWDIKNGLIDDKVISDNKDANKILVTIARTVLQFVKHFQGAKILIVGSTRTRTRLYQMAIAQNLTAINKHFDIQGLIDDHWENFRSGINFDAFLAKGKENN